MKLLLIIALSTALYTNANAGNFNVCFQHDVQVGFASSPSFDAEVLRTACFVKHGPKDSSKAAEQATHFGTVVVAEDHLNNPECWKGMKVDLGIDGGR